MADDGGNRHLAASWRQQIGVSPINPGLYADLPYDPIKDFAPITLVGASPHVLVVHPSLAAANVKGLVSLVRDSWQGQPRIAGYGTIGPVGR